MSMRRRRCLRRPSINRSPPPPVTHSSLASCLQVRSRPLALQAAGCGHAQRYMAALSRRAELQRGDCASMDGAQAFTLTMCSGARRAAPQHPGRRELGW